METIFLALDPLAGGLGAGLELLAAEISLLNFYSPHVDVGPAHSPGLPLLPIWMDLGFFNSVVVRVPFNLISDGSE